VLLDSSAFPVSVVVPLIARDADEDCDLGTVVDLVSIPIAAIAGSWARSFIDKLWDGDSSFPEGTVLC
jgi:hypothetical protein